MGHPPAALAALVGIPDRARSDRDYPAQTLHTKRLGTVSQRQVIGLPPVTASISEVM
jgi:hypothetical protein